MTSPYKRRRPSILRNLWVYRWLVFLAMVLGLILWFIWANNAKVTVFFPFGLGTYESRTGMVILLSALVGSGATALAIGLFQALRRMQGPMQKTQEEEISPLSDDRPPADYAAKASDESQGRSW